MLTILYPYMSMHSHSVVDSSGIGQQGSSLAYYGQMLQTMFPA